MKYSRIILLVALVVVGGAVHAAAPNLINYQGRLTNGSGTPAQDASYSVVFTIYDAAIAGTTLWSETQSVTTSGGLFTVLLGSVVAFPDTLFYDTSRYLGIKVGADPELTPRQRFTSVAYSCVSSQWTSKGQDLVRPTGKVGIGTPIFDENASLDVHSDQKAIHAYSTSSLTDSYGLHAEAYNAYGYRALGVQGVGSSSGGGNAYGGNFSASSSGGYAVGVFGENTGGANGTGVYGYSFYGTGVTAEGNGPGLSAHGWSTNGIEATGGVRGIYATGGTYGIVAGATANGGAGVYGSNGGNSATYGGYFAGDTRVTGNLVVDGYIYKNGGGFKIDDPLDPTNKYLYHSFVESPDMKNIYDGVVTLDETGSAVVTLPEWFGLVNGDFRYQLTAIGAPGPNLYIASEINNNQFTIGGGAAGMKVSWQVTGIRHDAYAKAHRIPVEEDKPMVERGKYLHPSEEGVPESFGIHYEETQQLALERKQMEDRRVELEKERLKIEQETNDHAPKK